MMMLQAAPESASLCAASASRPKAAANESRRQTASTCVIRGSSQCRSKLRSLATTMLHQVSDFIMGRIIGYGSPQEALVRQTWSKGIEHLLHIVAFAPRLRLLGNCQHVHQTLQQQHALHLALTPALHQPRLQHPPAQDRCSQRGKRSLTAARSAPA
jgi:hypothetical protein